MKSLFNSKWSVPAAAAALLIAAAATVQAQDLTTPCPNRVISWNANNGFGNINTTDLAGLAPAVNWVDMSLNNITVGLPDNAGNTTTLELGLDYINVSAIPWPTPSDPGLDANGTANKRMLNVYLNSGPAGWNPRITNVYVLLTNIPYARYDVVVYFDADASGRHASIDNGSGATYHFSTIGTGFRTGANALFLPTTETNISVFPVADFAFFPGMTAPNAIFTETPKSGMEQWLGICAFQVIESSNAYVLYGPAPTTQTIPVGQPASFKVMAGGLNPGYQWRHAGTNILDATNAAYSIAATAAGQDGNYDVVVANSFSSVTSVVATLTFYAPKNVEWRGNGSTWDTSSAFWTLSGGGAGTYTETDNVRFGPAGSAQPTVTLSGTHTPNSIVISNASYTFVSGGLAGAGSLQLKNNATFILDTVDGRTGPTVIDSGSTFQLDNGDTAGSMGAGAVTNNGALVFNAAGDEAYGYPVYGTGNITNMGPTGTLTLGSSLNANYLVQSGSGTLILQGNNSFVGGTVISGGTVSSRHAGNYGGAPILVTGGELRLEFGITYVASPLTLAGGTLHGFGGSQVFPGAVSLGADSTITVDGNNSLTFPNAAGLNGGSYNLIVGGGGTLVLGGANNSWASVTISGSTLQIGNGGPSGGVGAGMIQNDGTLAFNLSGSLVVTNPISGVGTISQNGGGITTLTGDNSAFGGAIIVTNGTLLINGPCGASSVTVAGGTLGGSGSFAGPISVQPGGTLTPGASVGTMTLNSSLSLDGGNLIFEVNKLLSPSNDVIVVGTGLAVVTTPGTVIINNLGPALAVGNTFQLFSQPLGSGELLTVTGSGATWTNRLATDGTVQVLTVSAVTRPVIASVSLASPTSLVLSGSSGLAGGPYTVRSSTNVTSPLAGWIVEASGNFDANGNFSVTNTVAPGVPQKFYLLQQ